MPNTRINLKIDWCSHEAAKFACKNWHYSKCVPAGKLVKLGVWENNEFIGVLIFSRGANNSLGKPYGFSQIECCELTRVALTKHKTTVSKILSIALKMLKKNNIGLKLVISFADAEQGHHGGIYQATNWIYTGKTKSADEYVVNGKRMHGRSMRALYGTHIGKDFIKIVKGSEKHRYLFPLHNDLREKLIKFSKPYPKRVELESKASNFQLEETGAVPSSTLNKNELLSEKVAS